MEVRFANAHEGLIAAHNLIPKQLPSLSKKDVDNISTYYGKFLSCDERVSLETEIIRWKKKFENVAVQDRPETAATALSECTQQWFPALNRILNVFLTTPVGSVACERSFSALRRLKLWTHSSMTEERLSGLAMLLIHRDTDFIPSPAEIYASMYNWRHSQSHSKYIV